VITYLEHADGESADAEAASAAYAKIKKNYLSRHRLRVTHRCVGEEPRKADDKDHDHKKGC